MRTRQRTSRPLGLTSEPTRGPLDIIRALGVATRSSWDLVVFVILFVVFVKFAIDVLLSLH